MDGEGVVEEMIESIDTTIKLRTIHRCALRILRSRLGIDSHELLRSGLCLWATAFYQRSDMSDNDDRDLARQPAPGS